VLFGLSKCVIIEPIPSEEQYALHGVEIQKALEFKYLGVMHFFSQLGMGAGDWFSKPAKCILLLCVRV
jgi:hypothetical protein